jgi:hypothetical protein
MAKKIQNKKLKESMKVFLLKAYNTYNDIFQENHSSHDTFIAIHLQDDTLKQTEEFKTCVQKLTADSKISPMLGKLAGTLSHKTAVGDAEMCILRFVQQLYLKKHEFDQALFDEQFFSFEELFYSDVIRFVDTSRLNYFDSEKDEIILEKGLVIKKSPRVVDPQTQIQEMSYLPHRHFSQSDFIIERKYTRPKRVDSGNGEANSPDTNEATKEMTENVELFDLVIKSLRILKSSAVFRDQSISTETLTFSVYGGISSRCSFIENIVLGDKCIVSTQEAIELRKIFSKIKNEKDTRFRIASNRLSYGLERQLDEDRILDYMIGLESLYLPDENHELTFRLSLRVGFITDKKMIDRKETYKFVKKIYNVRSKIVHGKENKLTKEDIKKLEEILRKSLKLFLYIPNKFTLDKVNNGEIVTEGVLDNIFFKR